MSKNDLRAGEKRWRRKHLFREQRPRTLPRVLTVLLILGALVTLAWWLKIPLFHLQAGNLLP